MLFAPILSALVFAVPTLAQTIQILSPTNNQTIVLGQPLVVTIAQPGGLGPVDNVAIALGIEHCGATPCSPDEDNQILGQIVAKSLFNPVRDPSEPTNLPSQSFTVTPSGEAGFATVHATILTLTGAGPTAEILQQSVNVNLVSALDG